MRVQRKFKLQGIVGRKEARKIARIWMEEANVNDLNNIDEFQKQCIKGEYK